MPYFYNLTLQEGGAISQCVGGNFTHPKNNELFAVHGKSYSLFRISDKGELLRVLRAEVFGIIRSVGAFRLAGCKRDYIALGSDSGRLTLLEFDFSVGGFRKVHQETFGKSGIRRVVAGEHLAVDPKGRALLLSAVEKQKFVYVLNRDASGILTISSPLEAHKPHQLCFDTCGLDVGYENPLFASLECNYEALDQNIPDKFTADGVAVRKTVKWPVRQVAFWEIDLGLNHVIKKCSLAVDKTANKLIPIPTGNNYSDGPGGVLVCSENLITYRKPDHPEIACAIPRRIGMEASRGVLITAFASHKMKDFFFILVQSDLGDIYKVEIVADGPTVSELIIRHFDSIPVASSLAIARSGYLFASMEFGNHHLYEFLGVGSEETVCVCSSKHPQGKQAVVPLRPQELRNLMISDTYKSLSPITDMKVIDCFGDFQAPQIYALCGRGPNSSLKILQHGVSVDILASSELPDVPLNIWTLKNKLSDDYDSWILIAFNETTLVLAVGDSIEEQLDSQFLSNRSTLHAAVMSDDSILQVVDSGFRQFQFSEMKNNRKVFEWEAPMGKKIISAASNASQLLLALSGGTLMYFEIMETGVSSLVETGTHEFPFEINRVAIQPLPSNRYLAQLGAVSGLDGSVRVISLDREKLLFRQVSAQKLAADSHVSSLVIANIPTSGFPNTTTTGSTQNEYCMFIGLTSGVLIRVKMDAITGQLQPERRSKFLGAQPVKLTTVKLKNPNVWIPTGKPNETAPPSNLKEPMDAVVAVSSKAWICTGFGGRFHMTKLLTERLESLAPFNSNHCNQGYVGVERNSSLKIFTIKSISSLFSETSMALSYTPRQMTVFPPPPTGAERQTARMKNAPIVLQPPTATRPWLIALIESDHNAFSEETSQELRQALLNVTIEDSLSKDAVAENPSTESSGPASSTSVVVIDSGDQPMTTKSKYDVSETQVGALQAGKGKWGSVMRLIDPLNSITIKKVLFDQDEAAMSIVVCQFLEYSDHPALVVGTSTGLNLDTRKCAAASIKVFVYDENCVLALLHSTPVEDTPHVLCAYGGRLVAAIGNRIRIYSLGRKRLLKRCEYKNLPNAVIWLRVSCDRIFAADVREGFHILQYNASENVLHVLADCSVPRWVLAGEVLDPYSVMGSDKFCNIFVNRLPPDAEENAELLDMSGLRVKGDTPYLAGQCHKMSRECEFHVGECVTAMQKCLLSPGLSEVVLYTTVAGTFGVMMPLQSKKEVDLLVQFEMLLRNDSASAVGRDPLFFRSIYFPVKNTIDGDLLETFASLKYERQVELASMINKTPQDLTRLLDTLRLRII